MDVTRFAQFGKWQGEIHYGGETVHVDAERSAVTRPGFSTPSTPSAGTSAPSGSP
jgi:hypothetical protein